MNREESKKEIFRPTLKRLANRRKKLREKSTKVLYAVCPLFSLSLRNSGDFSLSLCLFARKFGLLPAPPVSRQNFWNSWIPFSEEDAEQERELCAGSV